MKLKAFLDKFVDMGDIVHVVDTQAYSLTPNTMTCYEIKRHNLACLKQQVVRVDSYSSDDELRITCK